MKKITTKILALIVIFVFALSFSACSDNGQNESETPSQNQTQIDSTQNEQNDDNNAKPSDSTVPSETPDSEQTDDDYKFDVHLNEIDYNYDDELTTTEVIEKLRLMSVDIKAQLNSGISNGSGVIIGNASTDNDEEYFIATNHHVINGGRSFTVNILTIEDDGSESHTEYAASLIGSAPSRDIAVLAIRLPKDTVLSVASFIADSEKIKVGTPVYVIGNPLGILGGTVTHGIVSAKEREVYVDEIGTMTLMQTDATINGGNSGGGLFDTKGNLIGIMNSQYDTYNNESVEGLNFAIPGNDAKYAIKELIKTHEESADGTVTRYGYIEGDTRLEISLSTAMIYDDETMRSSGTYLIAAASSTSSPVYDVIGSATIAVSAITVNESKTEFGKMTTEVQVKDAEKLLTDVKVGDKIKIEYKEILSIGSGPFGFTYNYLESETNTVEFTASQYIYQI